MDADPDKVLWHGWAAALLHFFDRLDTDMTTSVRATLHVTGAATVIATVLNTEPDRALGRSWAETFLDNWCRC